MLSVADLRTTLDINGICTDCFGLGRNTESASAHRKIEKVRCCEVNPLIGNGTCTEFTGWDATDEALQRTGNFETSTLCELISL